MGDGIKIFKTLTSTRTARLHHLEADFDVIRKKLVDILNGKAAFPMAVVAFQMTRLWQ